MAKKKTSVLNTVGEGVSNLAKKAKTTASKATKAVSKTVKDPSPRFWIFASHDCYEQ